MPITFHPPLVPLTITVEIALGADLTAAPSSWAWTDITQWVRHRSGVEMSVGRPDEASTVVAGSMSLTLENDGRFSRRNPNSPYFGQLSRNTPIRVSIDAGLGDVIVAEMYVNEWPPRWDRSRRDATVIIKCAGILRRLQQGSRVKSALLRTITAASPTVHWPLENNAVPIVGPGLSEFGTVSYSSSLVPAGAASAADLTEGGSLKGYTGIAAGSATSWDVEVSIGWDELPTDSTDLYPVLAVFTPGSTVQFYGVWLYITGGAIYPRVFTYTDAGGLVASATSTVPVIAGTVYNLRVTAEQSGGNVNVTIALNGTEATASVSTVTLYAPTVINFASDFYSGAAPAAFSFPFQTAAPPRSLSHAAIWLPARATPATYLATGGHTGEMAHERMERVFDEESIPFTTAATSTVVMGPQPVGNVVDIARDAERVDMGVLYEAGFGLAYQSRAERENAAVALALDFDQGHIAEPPEPTDDDQRLRNMITAERPSGGKVTKEQTTGPLGTGPDGSGIYDDSVSTNVQTDDQLDDQAAWRLHVGTVDAERWPLIVLNFASPYAQELIEDWLALDYGARITLANPPDEVAPDLIDVFIEGVTQTFNPLEWRVEICASPAGAYRVGILAEPTGDTDPLLGRLTADDSRLDRALTSGATTAHLRPGGHRWTTTADAFDPDIRVMMAGEEIAVSAISDEPAFVAAGTSAFADNASASPGLPAGASANDLLVILAAIRNTAGTVGTPAGYTKLTLASGVALLWKVHSGSESAPTVTFSGGSAGDTTFAQMIALRGMVTDAAQVLVASNVSTNSSAQNIAYPVLEIPYIDTLMLLHIGVKHDDWTSVAAIGSGSSEISEPSSTTGNDLGAVWDYRALTRHALIPSGSFVVTGGAAAVSVGALVAFAGLQQLTITRSVNGVVKAQSAGALLEILDPLILTP